MLSGMAQGEINTMHRSTLFLLIIERLLVRRGFSNLGPKLWNELPNHIKQPKKRGNLKKKLL